MRFTNVIDERIKNIKMDWNNSPKIGWILESSIIKLYYGCLLTNVKNILENGITSNNYDYIKCAIEPFTALHQARMRLIESEKKLVNDNLAVCIIEYPAKLTKKLPLIIENDSYDRLTIKEKYNKWGKSDVEYYALIDVKVSGPILSEYIKGYMTR